MALQESDTQVYIIAGTGRSPIVLMSEVHFKGVPSNGSGLYLSINS